MIVCEIVLFSCAFRQDRVRAIYIALYDESNNFKCFQAPESHFSRAIGDLW